MSRRLAFYVYMELVIKIRIETLGVRFSEEEREWRFELFPSSFDLRCARPESGNVMLNRSRPELR